MRFVRLLILSALLVCIGSLGSTPAAAQGSSLVKAARNAMALRGAEKLEALIKSTEQYRSGSILIRSPEGRQLLEDAEVLALIEELDNPAVVDFMAQHQRVGELARLIRRSQATVRTGVRAGECLNGECAVSRLGDVIAEVDAKATEQALETARLSRGGIASAERLGETVPLGNEMTLVTEGGKLSEETKGLLETVSETTSDMRSAARRIANGCKGDPKCLEGATEQLSREPWFKRLFKNTCLGRHPEALRAAMYSYLIAYSALGLAYKHSDTDEFPFDYAGYILVANFLYSNLGCKNAFERGGSDGPASARDYFRPGNIGRNFIAYLKMEPINITLFLGGSIVEDAVRGRDVTDPAYLDKYLKEGMFLLVYDIAFLNMRAILVTDPVYLFGMPKATGWLNAKWASGILGKVVSEGGRKGILWAAAAGAPAMFLETGTRVGQRTVESSLLIELRERYAPSPSDDDDSTSDANDDVPHDESESGQSHQQDQ